MSNVMGKDNRLGYHRAGLVTVQILSNVLAVTVGVPRKHPVCDVYTRTRV